MDKQTDPFIKRIEAMIRFEEDALADDDPKGKCAAHHRGAIDAYRAVLRICEEPTAEPEPVDFRNIAKNLQNAGFKDGSFGLSDRDGGYNYLRLPDGRYEFRDPKTGVLVARVDPKE